MVGDKLELTDIQTSLNINKKFVLVDSSKYTDEAFEYILSKVDEHGSVAFVSDLKKIYAQGQYYSDLDELKYFTYISANNYDSEGNLGTATTMGAPGSMSTLTFVGKGMTRVATDSSNGSVIISTYTESIDNEIININKQLQEIVSTYATTTYVADNYQKTLTAGAYINISEDNVITTYNLPTFTYLSDNYATITYVTKTNTNLENFREEVLNDYATKQYTYYTAQDAAAAAVTKVIDGAADVFDTLKEISDWIINSGEYITVSDTQIAANPTAKYYVKDADGNYVDATYDEDGNVDTTSGQTTYMYVATTAADIITNIATLDEEVGDNYTYTTSDGNIFEGDTSKLVKVAGTDNQYTYETVSGDYIDVTFNDATGIYKVIEDEVAYLNSKIAAVSGDIQDVSKILYELTSESTSSYATLTFSPQTWDESESIARKLTLSLKEGVFNSTYGSSTYGMVTTDGLATTYTVEAMLDYRNGWVILTGNND